MQQTEFEQLTGTEVLPDAYKAIEAMYMDARSIDKVQFCKEWKKVKDVDLFRTYYTQFKELKEKASKQKRQLDSLAVFLIEQAHKYGSMECRNKAILMIGKERYLAYLIENDKNLWEDDKTDLLHILHVLK